MAAGANFGYGSSREHAVWAMLDYGIKAVIAESFSDIFASNAFRNGLLTVDLPAQVIQKLLTAPQSETLLIDLAEQRIQSSHGMIVNFDIVPSRKSYFLGGLDETALTLLLADDIASFERSRVARAWQIYATFVMFGLCLALSGGFACLIVVSDAVKKHRGLAIGVLLATASLGQAIAPVVLSMLQRIVGWKMAVDCIALIALGLIPFILVVIPKRLHAIASLPHGHVQLATFGASIRLKSFWGLAIVGGIGYMAAIGISTNLVLFYTKDLHLTATKIGLLMFVQFSTALLAQLLMGYLCDLVNKRVMHAACVGLMAAGCCCLGLERESLVFLAVVLFGVGWGGNYVLLQFLMTHLFSGPSVGRIVGFIALVEALGGAVGPMVIGKSYDMTGNYSNAFLVVAAALLLTAVIASQIRKASV